MSWEQAHILSMCTKQGSGALPADPQDPSGLGQAQLKVTQLGPIRTRFPDPMVPPSAGAEAQSLTGTPRLGFPRRW